MKTRPAFRLLLLLLLPVMLAGQTNVQQTNQTTQSRDLALRLDATQQAPEGVPRGYALVIGIANYKNLDESAQLRFPETDAEAIYRVLISKEGGAFPSENVHLLKGKEATLVNIRRELEEWLPSVAQPPDRVVVYFAGHGFVKGGKGYLAAWDIDPDRVENTAYPMSSLGNVLANRVKARWKVLLTDACHSGKINPETTNESVDAELKNLPASFLTLTATTEREKSYEDPGLSTGFGVFSYFLLQAFKGQADNDPCDGKITADEVIEYVRANVKSYVRARDLFQTPNARGDYEPDMVLGVSPACLPTAADRAAPLVGTAVVETTMDDVDVYLDGNLIGRVSKAKPLVMPGLSSGLHKFEGAKTGYEPDRKEIMIVPGQEITVTLRIRYVRQIKKSSLDLDSEGEKLLLSQRSSVNPLNIVPVAPSQTTGDLKKARDFFVRALAEDSNNSKAAFHLGQANQMLSEQNASIQAYKKAVEIDSSFADARRQYAAVLIESGDAEEAIRQLLEGTRLDPENDEAYSLLARAYWDKGVWDRAVDMANQALEINPSNEQAHLWKGDSLRQLAAVEKNKEQRQKLYERARESYRTFLNLTNYSTPAGDWIAFHFIGFGIGSRRHADRQISYTALRNAGFLGVCLCEENLGNPLKAREYCQRAIKYDSEDPIAHFILGNVYRDLFNTNTERCDYILLARDSYSRVIKLNPDIAESKNAKIYLSRIEQILPVLRSKGCRS